MSKQIAALTYTFVFDPSETWSHLSQFESTLGKYFSSINLKAEVITPIGNNMAGKMLLISKLEEEITTPPKQSKTPAGKQIDKLGKKYGNR